MRRIAAIWTDSVNMTLHLADETVDDAYGTYPGLTELGGRYDTKLEQWFVPVARYEEVLTMLDREGFVWAVDDKDRPRTWAGRMLAETPPGAHEHLYRELRRVLHHLGERDHVVLLDHEWEAIHTVDQGPTGA
jgi:hypothetical protein